MPFTTIRPFDALSDQVLITFTMTAVRATLALTVVALLQPRASAGRPLPPWPYVRTSGKLPGIAWFGANETGFEVSHTDSASLLALLQHFALQRCAVRAWQWAQQRTQQLLRSSTAWCVSRWHQPHADQSLIRLSSLLYARMHLSS